MPRPEYPLVDDDSEPGGEKKLLQWVPELLLELEFPNSSISKDRGGSLLTLERRGPIQTESERLEIPAEDSRYRTGPGVVWFLSTGVPGVAYPSRVNIPPYGVRRGDGPQLRDDLAKMKCVRRQGKCYIGRVLERNGITTQSCKPDELVDMLRDAVDAVWAEKDLQLELVLTPDAARRTPLRTRELASAPSTASMTVS